MDDELSEGEKILGLDGVSEILEKKSTIYLKKLGMEELRILKRKKLG